MANQFIQSIVAAYVFGEMQELSVGVEKPGGVDASRLAEKFLGGAKFFR
jgi:hypothetical protein